MKHLRQYIRNVLISQGGMQKNLQESAAIIEDSLLAQMQKEDLIFVVSVAAPYSGTIYLLRREDYDEDSEYLNTFDPIGEINLTGTTLEDTMAIENSNVVDDMRNKGYGKLLYNVALMACSGENMWLVADRNDVTKSAQRIWQAWIRRPDMYEIEQMDHNMIGNEYFLTDDEEDDMIQNSFHNYQWLPDNDMLMSNNKDESWFFRDSNYRQQFLNSGLTKRIKMKDDWSFYKKLESNDMLYYFSREQ